MKNRLPVAAGMNSRNLALDSVFFLINFSCLYITFTNKLEY